MNLYEKIIHGFIDLHIDGNTNQPLKGEGVMAHGYILYTNGQPLMVYEHGHFVLNKGLDIKGSIYNKYFLAAKRILTKKKSEFTVAKQDEFDYAVMRACGSSTKEAKNREKIEYQLRVFLDDAMGQDYSVQIFDLFKDEVVEDVNTSADEEWSLDDVKLAIGRVLCKKLGLEY